MRLPDHISADEEGEKEEEAGMAENTSNPSTVTPFSLADTAF